MKILHTSDIHLASGHTERVEALKALVSTARKYDVDALTIAGDFLDNENDVVNLEPEIRKIFSEINFPVFLIPGNHDEKAYRSGIYLGKNVKIITSPEEKYRVKDFVVKGLPYSSEVDHVTELLKISRDIDPHHKNLLMIHCDLLDISGDFEDRGTEGDERYFPVYLDYFKELPFSHVLAGHFHTKTHIKAIPGSENRFFIYPGSPVSITRKETGKRSAILLTDEEVTTIPLDTFHFEEIEIKFEIDKNPESVLKKLSTLNPDSNTKIILKVTGFTNSEYSPEALENEIKKLIQPYEEQITEFLFLVRDLSHVLEDPIVQKVIEIINNEYRKDSKELTEFYLKAVTGVTEE